MSNLEIFKGSARVSVCIETPRGNHQFETEVVVTVDGTDAQIGEALLKAARNVAPFEKCHPVEKE